MSASFARLATVNASTKRAPAMVAGKRGAAVLYLANLKITPLDSVSAEVMQRLALDTPHEVLTCFAAGQPDITEGDALLVAGVEYPIKKAQRMAPTSTGPGHVQLFVEDLKR